MVTSGANVKMGREPRSPGCQFYWRLLTIYTACTKDSFQLSRLHLRTAAKVIIFRSLLSNINFLVDWFHIGVLFFSYWKSKVLRQLNCGLVIWGKWAQIVNSRFPGCFQLKFSWYWLVSPSQELSDLPKNEKYWEMFLCFTEFKSVGCSLSCLNSN